MSAPAVVEKSRIKEGKLLNDEQKKKVQDFFESHPEAVLYAGEEILPYPVILSKEGNIFVLYATPKQLHYTPAETSKIAFQDESQTTTPKPLGGGASAIVVAAQSLEDDSWSAAKFQTTTRDEESTRQEIVREQRVLSMMNLFKGSATIEQVATTLDTKSVTTMTMMELSSGMKLEKLIEEDKRKPEDQKLQLEQVLGTMIQLTKKTDGLAKKGLVQCDFNPKNVMCEIRLWPEIKTTLIDFGEVYELNENGEFLPKDKVPDTPGFGAPEISKGGYLTHKGCYSENTMAFSLGKTLSALLGDQSHNILEKASHQVVQKLSHEDPNQRINAELAAEELIIINDYHELLKKSGGIDSHKESASLREHMRKTGDSKGELWPFNADLRKLEQRLTECQHKQSVYQGKLLEKRLESYVRNFDKEPKSKSHIREMKRIQNRIQKLNPNQENYSAKLESLRTKAYQKQTKFEHKPKAKHSKEASKVTDRVTNWFRSLPRSASISRDSPELPRSTSASSIVNSDISRTPSTTSTASSTRSITSTSSTILSVDDNPLFSLDSRSPSPVMLSRNGSGRPLPPTPTTPPYQTSQQNGVENKTLSSGFSPAFKNELEKKLTALSEKKATSEEISTKTSSKSPTSKRGASN